ncbi:MAG: PAS domain S-box protein, partial [Sphingobacteriales bacterium]
MIKPSQLEKSVEEKLNTANRLYHFISQVNQDIVRTTNEEDLFHNSCQIALEFGKFKMAWIGLFDDKHKKITLTAQSGVPAKIVKLFTNASLQTNGPQRQVLRTNDYYICNEIELDPELESLKQLAPTLEVSSCMVLPIRRASVIIGTFNLYATAPGFFNKEEIELLTEVTGDISFALDMLEKNTRQKAIEKLLVNNEKKFHHTLDNMLEGVQMHDFEWRYIYVNDASVKASPFTREEKLGFTLMEKHPGIEQTNMFNTMKRCMDERVAEHFDTEFVFPDGSKKYYELSINPIPEGISILSVDRTEQKKAKELVISNEKRFRTLIENGTDMITMTNPEGEILYSSPSISKVFGYSSADISHTLAVDFIHPEHVRHFLENRQKILKTPGASFFNVLPLRHANGNWIWCEVTLTNRLDEPGINAMVSNFRDISEKKKAEQARIESKNLVQTIYKASLDAVIVIDADGMITKWDSKSEKLFGWTAEDVAGMELSAVIIPKKYRAMHDNGIKHYLRTGEGPVLGKTIDTSAVKKSGEEFDISLSISPSKIDGKTCFIGFIRDNSEKRAVDKQREFDKNNLNALINNTTDLMWSIDLNNKLITFNQPFLNIIKLWSGKEFIKGDDIFSASFPIDQIKRFKSNFKRAFAGEAFTITEHTESAESWSEISYCPIRKGEEVIGVACHSHNIT